MPLFAAHPAALDRSRYEAYGRFLLDNKLIKTLPPVDDYAIELK